eukprot:1202959-Rhodomonas_salina.1
MEALPEYFPWDFVVANDLKSLRPPVNTGTVSQPAFPRQLPMPDSSALNPSSPLTHDSYPAPTASFYPLFPPPSPVFEALPPPKT